MVSEQIIPPGQVRVEVAGLLRRRHRLCVGTRVVGELTLGLGSPTVYSDAAGRTQVMAPTAPWSADYRLGSADRELGHARWQPLRGEYEIEFAHCSFRLRAAAGAWELLDAQGARLLLLRGAELTIAQPLAAELMTFAYYLVVTRQRAARRTLLG